MDNHVTAAQISVAVMQFSSALQSSIIPVLQLKLLRQSHYKGVMDTKSRPTLRSCQSHCARPSVNELRTANLNFKSRWIGDVKCSQHFLMLYKQYTVQTFERELGKWRASVRRTDGRLLWKGRSRIRSFVTGIDVTTP